MRKFLAGAALALALASPAFAVGTAPQNGFGMVDGTWLNGLAGGLNQVYQYGLTAAGTTQATATQIPSGVALVQFDNVASGTGGALPLAQQGDQLLIYNNGSNTLNVYPSALTNPLTGTTDTLNNGTLLTVTSHSALVVFCAKNGVWAAH